MSSPPGADENGQPVDALFEEGEAYYYGLGDVVEDYDEALRLFKLAARLGSLGAFEYLGEMFQDGRGVRANPKDALTHYREGAKRGNYLCYARMGALYWNLGHYETILGNGPRDRWPAALGTTWTPFTAVVDYLNTTATVRVMRRGGPIGMCR